MASLSQADAQVDAQADDNSNGPSSSFPERPEEVLPSLVTERIDSLSNGGKHICCFSLWGSRPIYTKGALANATLVPLVYPGWKARFYIGPGVPDAVVQGLITAGAQVFRYSGNIPGMLVRFMAAKELGLEADSLEAIIVRDADSRVNGREAAAVTHWLAEPKASFHVMHEKMHDGKYGEVMGGMWGARAGGSSPCSDIESSIVEFLARGEGEKYGDDMRFLSAYLVPRMTSENTIHHVDGDQDRRIGDLRVPRSPFPPTEYRGFVGQPINCLACKPELFAATGCSHVSRMLPGELASRLNCQPDVLNSLNQFLG